MKIKKIKVFSYEELTDSSKERARANFLEFDHYPWMKDAEVSLKNFCDHFGVKGLDYQIGGYCPSYVTAEADNSHFKGRKLKDYKVMKHDDAYYCLEFDLWENFVNIWEETGSPLIAFNQALDKAGWSIQKDMEYHQSDEYVEEMMEINEYEFTEDGETIGFGFVEAA
jgi:hypothetical protein